MTLSPVGLDFRPRLRPYLQAAPAGDGTGTFALSDRRRLVPHVLTVPAPFVEIANAYFDGSRSVREVHADLAGRGVRLPAEGLVGFAAALDAALFLDGPAFAAYLAGPTRLPSCLGCYPPDPADIRNQLDALFTAPGGPGLPGPPAPGRLRAVLAPHMDYARGGVTYGWAFKELADRTDARLFVVVATSHYSPHRFTLTRMNFETPLGVVETDQAYVTRIADAYGPGAFADPVAHLPEHSVELEVLMLQHVLAGRRPFRIVPLVCGSFGDRVDARADPGAAADIARMVAALRAAEAAAGEPVCYVISGDLAHIGPKFDDPDPVSKPQLAASKAQDEKLLDRLGAADPAGYFGVIAAEGDARRVCGLPPTWVTLAAARPASGRVLHYGRYVHPHGHESVSFAAAAFYE
jgi:AmmeMemoRadiSam system protein B